MKLVIRNFNAQLDSNRWYMLSMVKLHGNVKETGNNGENVADWPCKTLENTFLQYKMQLLLFCCLHLWNLKEESEDLSIARYVPLTQATFNVGYLLQEQSEKQRGDHKSWNRKSAGCGD